MKTIIAGSRDIKEVTLEVGVALLLCPFYNEITEVISGHARGADRAGEQYARGTSKKLTVFPADWEKYGKRAGYLRNKEMANYADALIAVWDGKSKGTKMMINAARNRNLKIFVHLVNHK